MGDIGRFNRDEWIGQKFCMLTVIEPVHVKNKMGSMWYWRVRCDCGKEKVIRPTEVISGKNKSCGCYRFGREPWNKSHGESHTHLHNVWCGMNNRCNPNHKNSEGYGDRGIKVCEEWKSYEAFANWARIHGYQDGLTIERIDVNGDYCPENCTWIPLAKQARNRRTTHWVEYQGEQMSLAEACERAGLPYKQVFWRMRRAGWPFEKAISVPMGADIGIKEHKNICVICGKEFVSHSKNSKYCSHECYLEYRRMKKHERTDVAV